MGALIVFVGLTIWRLYFAPTPPRIVMVRGEVMGTTYTVKVVAQTREEQSEQSEAALAKTVKQALDAVDQSMSTYKPDSELSRFNEGPGDQDVGISPALADVLTVAFDVHDRSGGAFDVTVGPLVERWGFGARGGLTEVPSQADIDAFRARLGHEHLDFDVPGSTLRKDAKDLRVDLSAIAKGYGVDQAAAALHEAGWDHFLVEVGG